MSWHKLAREVSVCVRRTVWLLVGGVGLFFAALTQADDTFSPMLTLRVGEQVLELQREQLDALPQHELRTTTTLNEGASVWSGPLIRDVLALLKVENDQPLAMTMNSWDDYRVDLTTEDVYRWDVIVAQRVDGKELSVLDLGPLRVVYPRDQYVELQDSRFDHRWVWMLREIVVTP